LDQGASRGLQGCSFLKETSSCLKAVAVPKGTLGLEACGLRTLEERGVQFPEAVACQAEDLGTARLRMMACPVATQIALEALLSSHRNSTCVLDQCFLG